MCFGASPAGGRGEKVHRVFHLASEIATSDIFRRPPHPADAHSRARARDVARPRAFSAPPRFDDERPKALAHAPRQPAKGRSPSLLRQVFGMPTPNDETRLVQSDSFRTCTSSGEEEAHDYFHRKWEANRRTSLDERQREAHQRAVVAPLAAERTRRRRPRRSTRRTLLQARGAEEIFDGAFALGGVLPAETPRSRPRRRRRGKRASRSPRWTRTTGTERRDEPRGARRASPERTTGKKPLERRASTTSPAR